MAAPFTIVTFTDEDGDEFPIRVNGTGKTEVRAWWLFQDAENAGEIRPAGVVKLTAIEHR